MCKKEKDHKVRTRMVAVRMVRVLNMSVDETACILVHCPTWVRDRLRCDDEGGLEGLRDLPRCGWPRRILLATEQPRQFAYDGPYPFALLVSAAGNQNVSGFVGRGLFHHAANILPTCVKKESIAHWTPRSVADRRA